MSCFRLQEEVSQFNTGLLQFTGKEVEFVICLGIYSLNILSGGN